MQWGVGGGGLIELDIFPLAPEIKAKNCDL